MAKDKLNALVLKPGREKSLKRHHPWVFSGAVESVKGKPSAGGTVAVLDSGGGFLAWASYSPSSQIRARVWTFTEHETVCAEFLLRRIRESIARRKPAEGTNALRLIYSESDGLPGLIADRYADVVVLQFLSAGADHYRETISGILEKETGASCVYERSDADVRAQEGLSVSSGVLKGGPLPEKILIEENGLKFYIDAAQGHKTGFYLDQSENRAILRGFSRGAEVLNCFSYTGGFSVAALAGGAAKVTEIDSSEPALALAAENAELNGFAKPQLSQQRADVFEALRAHVNKGKKYDIVVLDPPKFAATKEQLPKAERAYKDINMLGMKLLKPGGLLFTFSCSGAVSAEAFRKYVSWAALDAGVEARVVRILSQAVDHPITLSFPPSEYLKGLVLRVD